MEVIGSDRMEDRVASDRIGSDGGDRVASDRIGSDRMEVIASHRIGWR